MLEVTREAGRPVDLTKYARVSEFFENDYIFVRELDVLLADSALKLIYHYLWLRPNDAAHLAAAIDTGCQVFYTFDDELVNRFDGEHGLRVVKPGTSVSLGVPGELQELPLFNRPDDVDSE